MIKIITVIGARPQIIKAAALSRAISEKYSSRIKEIILHTGQHYDSNMSEVFFTEMKIPKPGYSLNVGSGSHGKQTAAMLQGIEEVLLREDPDAVVVYGDTNSTIAASLAASKLQIPVVHIESGLRSFNRSMPEEINRVLCDHTSTILFAPTVSAIQNLTREGIIHTSNNKASAEHPAVYHCGDVMLDNNNHYSKISGERSDILKRTGVESDSFNLLTIHRDNNTDDPARLSSILEAILQLCEKGEVFVFPAHPRTVKMLAAEHHQPLMNKLRSTNNFVVTEPVSFFGMLELEKSCRMVFTDSGGVQKEAFFNKKPCIILRPETEWVELVESGNAIITDADTSRILSAHATFTEQKRLNFPPLYGDGHAAEFICEKIISHLG